MPVQLSTSLTRYNSLFKEVLNDLPELVLFDNCGQLQWCDESGCAKAILSSNDDFITEIKWHDGTQLRQQSNLDTSQKIYLVPLKLGAAETLYWCCLVVGQGNTSTLNEKKINLLFQILNEITLFIIDDYRQTEILNGMSDELAARYEELNLLYGIDAGFSVDQNKSDEEIYAAVVKDCCSYMDVDLVSLIIEDHQPIVAKNDNDFSDDELDSILNKFKGPLYTLIASEPSILVVNKDEVVDWSNPNVGVDFKYMVAPIYKGKERMHGILVIANRDNKKSFTNSDRKLCEVLAAEVSKLSQARHDELTGLYNKIGYEKRLARAIKSSYEQSKKSAMLYLDVDQFKLVNELSGHNAGDVLLQQIASLIPSHIRKSDVFARLSGDEFAIILENCPLSKALTIAEDITNQIEIFRFVFLDKIFDVTASMGVVMFGDTNVSVEKVLGEAESACITAKELGRNQVRVYEESDEVMVKRRDDVLWVSRIHNAIEDDRFRLYRQQIKALKPEVTGEGHYEILLRMIDEEGELLSPFSFIPAAERYDQMTKIDRWVIAKSLATLLVHDEKVGNNNLSLSINLSGQSLCESGFSSFIVNAIKKSNIEPSRICFEITETAAIVNMSYALKFIEIVSSIGCTFSLDDFGSGMSSFSYLKNLPVDYLKIDGHFVKTILEDPVGRVMVESIHHIGHVMGLETIAEFVETEEMIGVLEAIGVDYIQGYALGKPEPFDP